jgi:D-arabinose 1-dehydrogenase-like Zn-dependent alcohol dehydrogenase
MAVAGYDRPLEWLDLPAPEPRPRWAILEVLTCGVCATDVKTARGRMPFSEELRLPHVPGHEICARVVAADPPVLESGTVVVVYHLWPCRRCERCRAGVEQLCLEPVGWTGFKTAGGFQQQLAAPIDRLAIVPPGIDPVHAAPLTCAIGTGYRAVVTRARAKPGSKLVIIGAGGVGIHALQIARALGAQVVGLDVSERAIEVAASLGLEVVAAGQPDAEDRIREALGGPADAVVDTVGTSATLQRAFRLARPAGRIVGVGYSVASEIQLPTARFVLEEVELVGSRYVSMDELDRAIAMVAMGQVKPVIDRVLPLERANEALDALDAGEVVGRIVLDVAGAAS